MKAILKQPMKFGRLIEVRNTLAEIAAVLGAEPTNVDEIQINDIAYVFDRTLQHPGPIDKWTQTFACGGDTMVQYRGRNMQIRMLCGKVLIVGIVDGEYTDVPRRLQRIAEDMA